MLRPLPRFLVSAALLACLLLAAAPRVSAHTGDDEEFTCPLCDKTFESYVQGSGTSFGQRLDFKEVGAIRSPWPIPRCTHCGFVLFKESLEEAEKAKLRTFVNGDAYAPHWKKHTNYYALGLIGEAVEGWSAQRLGFVFLRATWELGSDDERYPAYATKAAGYFAKVKPPAPDAEDAKAKEAQEDHLVAHYLQVELHRRAGRFDRAQAALEKIAELDTKAAPDWFDATLAFQTTLVKKKDAKPYDFSDVPRPDAKAGEDEGSETGSGE